ncbi:MAG: hypothetical protein C0594_09060 [Marinilabiliales bacterium]|nr:MAG: hypothetical protein C0594_09060 [Marinilabiliales bacterium]
MAEVKGKFITLTCMLMQNNPEVLKKADEYLEDETGCTHMELDPEEFYDTKLWDTTMTIYSEAHDDPKQAIINLGKRVYPTIKRTAGMPPHLKTPLDFVRFEAEGYLANHNGDDVIPRKIINESEKEITMYAPAPGYNEHLYIGVWLGILEMIGINTGQVDELGDSTYRIYW